VKLEIDAKVLANAISAVESAVAPRTTKPVLAMVKLSLTAGVVSVMATDSEVAVKRIVAVAEGDDGAVLLDPKKAVSWLKEQSGVVTVEDAGDDIRVRQGKKTLGLPKMDADAFPDYTDATTGTTEVVMPYKRLARLLELTAFAADKKEGARWATTGVMLKVSGGKLEVVATDTKRLALATQSTDAADGAVLVPLKAADLVLKNGPGAADEVAVVMAPNAAVFRTDRWSIHTRLVEGKFPPYGQIIPKKLDHTAEVEAGPFASAIREAAVATDDAAKRVEFKFGDEACVMSARTGANGWSESECAVPGFDGDVNIALDPQYVLDGFKAFGKGEIVTVRLTDETKPVLFQMGDDYTFLVMPLGEREG
jgi:DNA polymerase III subunit beta